MDIMKKDYHRCETPEGEWDLDMCRELCEDAGMLNEWENADGETFEQVIYKAADKIGVNLFE